MRVVKKGDIEKSEKFAVELKLLLGEGRKERDKKIAEIEEELLGFKKPWDDNFFMGRTEELKLLQQKINERRTQKGLISSRWITEVSGVSSSLEKLNAFYAPEIVGEITLKIKGIEKSFDYSYFPEDKIYYGGSDSYTYKLVCNLDAVNQAEENLLVARKKIISGKSVLSLREILRIYDDALSTTPSDFPLNQEVVGGSEVLANFRSTREMAAEPMLFENSQRYFSVTSPNFVGETLGKKQVYKDYFEK